MARPSPNRLDPANYPVAIEVQTRFQDLDPLGHINNGAMAAIIETGRIAFNRQVGVDGRDRQPGERWLIARLETNYVAEGHYPEPVTIGHGFGRVGTSSWDILAGVFQGETCIATADCTIVLTGENGAVAIGDEQRVLLAQYRFRD